MGSVAIIDIMVTIIWEEMRQRLMTNVVVVCNEVVETALSKWTAYHIKHEKQSLIMISKKHHHRLECFVLTTLGTLNAPRDYVSPEFRRINLPYSFYSLWLTPVSLFLFHPSPSFPIPLGPVISPYIVLHHQVLVYRSVWSKIKTND